MSTRTIYDALRAAGLTREGACGTSLMRLSLARVWYLL